MSKGFEIASWTLAGPATWHAVPTVFDTGPWPEEVAAQLCDEGPARDSLAERLRATHKSIIGREHGSDLAGIWVPDRTTGVVHGLMYLDLVLTAECAPPPTREWARARLEADDSGGYVYSSYVDDVDLPAGPALAVREIVAERSGRFKLRRTLEEKAIYLVFPPGAGEALRFLATTLDLHLGEDLAAGAAAIVETLRVELSNTTAP